MSQLLYLLTSIVPILLMYVVYRTVEILLPLLQNGTFVESLALAWKRIISSPEVITLTKISIFLFLIGLTIVIWKACKTQKEIFQYDSVSNLNSEALNFFLALALGLITADKLNYPWLATLIVFLAVLGWQLNDYKVNLLLWFLGMRQYTVCHGNGIEHTLITRRTLKQQQDSVNVVRLAENLLMEVG